MDRRSHLAHKFAAQARVNRQVGVSRSALSAAGKLPDTENHTQPALYDLTLSNRAGFRGGDIDSWLQEALGVSAPPINRARITQPGLLVVRLSATEILVQEDIDDQQGACAQALANVGTESILKRQPYLYYLPRQDSHACFLVSGAGSAQLFAKLCAVDLRYHKFPNLGVAQTVIARVNAIVVRRDYAAAPGFLVLVDSSLAEYLWDCLVDAMKHPAAPT